MLSSYFAIREERFPHHSSYLDLVILFLVSIAVVFSISFVMDIYSCLFTIAQYSVPISLIWSKMAKTIITGHTMMAAMYILMAIPRDFVTFFTTQKDN